MELEVTSQMKMLEVLGQRWTPTLWGWTPKDPYAVRWYLDWDTDQCRELQLSRDLLAGGVQAPAGEGGIRLHPCGPAIAAQVKLPGQRLVFAGARLVLVLFLRRTYQMVPAGRESEHMDIDQALSKLLAGGAR